MSERGTRGSTISTATTIVVAVALGLAATRFAVRFEEIAVREFRYAWGTWIAALVLAAATGAVLAPFRLHGVGLVVGIAALLVCAAITAHFPLVAVARESGWDGSLPFGTERAIDGAIAQLVAASSLGAIGAGLLAGLRNGSGRIDEPLE